MKRSYWVQLGGCVAFLLLLVASKLSGEWYEALPWPWNGLLGIGNACAELASPFVFIYLVILAKKLS